MNNLECPVCGSSNIQTEKRPNGFHHCMDCRYSWEIGAKQLKQTLFETITTSPEVLARSLCGSVRVGCFSGYYSMLTGEYYPDMEAAVSATVARLKEVAK